MNIQKDSVVTLRYKLADLSTNKLIEESSDPMVYLHGGYDNTFPKVEAALEGKEAGFRATVLQAYSIERQVYYNFICDGITARSP